jgi:hypothetical protein
MYLIIRAHRRMVAKPVKRHIHRRNEFSHNLLIPVYFSCLRRRPRAVVERSPDDIGMRMLMAIADAFVGLRYRPVLF